MLHWFDIVIGVTALWFVIHGMWVGFFRGIFRYLSLLCGGIAAFWGYAELLQYAPSWLHPLGEVPLKILSAVLAFLLVAGLFQLLGIITNRIIQPTPLGWVDRILGGGLGAVKVVCLWAIVALAVFNLPLPPAVTAQSQQSQVMHHISRHLPQLMEATRKAWESPESLTKLKDINF